MVPVAPPYTIDDFYTPAEVDALFGVVKNHGPWPLMSALHFKTAEEFLAVAGGPNRPKDAKLTDYTSPSFRGYFAQDGVCFYDEVYDIYFSKRLIEIAKTGHYTSVFSAAEIFAVLYYDVMRLRKGEPAWPSPGRSPAWPPRWGRWPR